MFSEIFGQVSQQLFVQSKYDTAAAVICASLLLTQRLWYRYLPISDNIPESTWHQIPQKSWGISTVSTVKKNESRNVHHVFSKQKIDMVIFWGSQSGRGEMLARRLAKNLYDRFGLRTLAADLDDFDHHHLTQLEEHHLCGFVLSTYGDGDPPDNTSGLWDTLSKLGKNDTKLRKLRYLMFGLGNSNYR